MRQRQTLRFKTKLIIAGSTVLVLFLGAFVFFNFNFNKQAYAAVLGDYRSAASGNWSSASTWETYDGASWVAAVATPASADGVITIQNGHTITIDANVSPDQVVVDAGGTLTITTDTLLLVNGIGTDLTVAGTLNINSTLNVSSSATVTLSGTGNLNSSGTLNVEVSGIFTVASNGKFTTGAREVTGAGRFTAASGSELFIGSPLGITTVSTAVGSIQTGIRSFSSGADYTYNGSSAQVTGNGIPATVRNLTINNSSGVILSKTVSVSGILTLTNGILTTNAFEVRTTNTSTSSITGYSSSNYIIGNLRRSVSASGSYDFPLGTSSNYEFANVNLSATTGFSNILGSFTNANPIEAGYPLVNVYVGITPITDVLNYGYWTLDPGITWITGTYTVTLSEKGHTNSAASPDQYCVLKRGDTGYSWESFGTHNNNTQSEVNGVATAVRSAMDHFCNYAIGRSAVGPLPVTLVSFTAKEQSNNTVVLNWITAAELNNDYFTLERSQNGTQFSTLTKVEGAGSSTDIHKYFFTDDKPLGGTSYYRLKQTDFNGTTEMFKTVSVTFKSRQNTVNAISISPNPFTDSFTAQFESEEAGEVSINILSTNGVLVFSEKVMADAGNNVFHYLNLPGFKQGTYVMRVSSAKAVIATGKMVCRK
jgi:hypothetical protein